LNLLEASRPIEVLLLEDDLGDVELTKEAIEATRLAVNLSVVRDGEEAMTYLRKEGSYADAASPDLVLLDLNMPRKDGREVLRDMKDDPTLTHIPVVVLTTSDSDEDIVKSYDIGANCYVTKPVGLEQFMKVVQSIGDFWFMFVKLPNME
jgi:chemotaxis family two-component system response regulator Rcp1